MQAGHEGLPQKIPAEDSFRGSEVEILQLQSQAGKLIAKLGSEVYVMLVDKNHTTVSRETASIRDLLTGIERVRTRIEAKEKEYRSISTKKKAAS